MGQAQGTMKISRTPKGYQNIGHGHHDGIIWNVQGSWVSTTQIEAADVKNVVNVVRSYTDEAIGIATGRHGNISGFRLPGDRHDLFTAEDLATIRGMPNVTVLNAWSEAQRIGEMVAGTEGPKVVILAWCYSDVTRDTLAAITEYMQRQPR